MSDIEGRDMEWPHCKKSVIAANVWNTELGLLMSELEAVKDESWWICDIDLKYLNFRIDTRDNAFILTVGERYDGAPVRIDPQRVIDAISMYRQKYMVPKENKRNT